MCFIIVTSSVCHFAGAAEGERPLVTGAWNLSAERAARERRKKNGIIMNLERALKALHANSDDVRQIIAYVTEYLGERNFSDEFLIETIGRPLSRARPD